MALKDSWKDKVNGKDIVDAEDINSIARAVIEIEEKETGGITQETDPTVPAWAKQENKPTYKASEVGAVSQAELEGAVDNALAEAKASGEFDGADGVSPTISVSAIAGGHRITITDKDGTKTVDIMDGEDGEDGKNGADGSSGKDGTSVTVTNITTSPADGGSNVVTFSDGKTVTIKNGSKGSKGDTGAAGLGFMPNIVNLAHRGAMPNEIPENTLPAVVKAAAMGFDYVEIDLRFTADGVPVNLHDETINRTARNADGSTISTTINIADITYEQALQYVFCGEATHNLYSKFPDVKIPTLEEMVSLCKALGVGVCFDLYPLLTTDDVELIYSILDKYGMRDRVIMGSSTYINVKAIVDYYPKAIVSTRTSTYGDPLTEGYDVVLPKVLNGLRSVYTGQNYVIGNVRTDYIEQYAPVLFENGFGTALSTIPVTDDELLYASKYYSHIMAETYVPTARLKNISMGNEAPIVLTKGEYNDILKRITLLEGGEWIDPDEPSAPTSILNLNRTQGTNWNNESAEKNYINPAGYGSVNPPSGSLCEIANLTENSITVTENGTGGTGVAFPILLYRPDLGIDRRGKSYTLTWNATGTTDTRFRLMMGGSTLQTADLDNKNGTITSATIVISADGKTITVNGTAYTSTTERVFMAVFFGAATGKTVSYTGVSLVENT